MTRTRDSERRRRLGARRYLKVSWYDDPQANVAEALATLWPQLRPLMTVVFLGAARLLARR